MDETLAKLLKRRPVYAASRMSQLRKSSSAASHARKTNALRMLVLKHLFDWSYDDLGREVRANLVCRAFTPIDAGEVPDAKTILKIAGALGPDVVERLHRQVVDVAKRAGVTHGRRFRIDTTVVETDVHYPTNSSLLRDGVRVLTRTMQRASVALGDPRGRVRNRLRSVSDARSPSVGRRVRRRRATRWSAAIDN
jgi:IS5 family transposase